MSPADTPPQSPWGETPKPEKKPTPKPADNNPFGSRHGAGNGGGYRPGGQGNNQVPPDLDELLRRSQERFKSMLPDGRWQTAGLAIGIIAALWLSTGIYRVQEGQIGVVLRFGQVDRTAQPGLRYHLPYPIETALTPNVTFENRIEIGFRSGATGGNGEQDIPEESIMLTADQNIIDLDFAVTWVVKDPSQFLFEIRDPEATVKRAAESAMREVVGQTPIQEALTEARDSIQRDTKTLLQQILDDYKSGVEIVRVELLRVNPPVSVVDAFNDVQRAEADRERLRNEAEAYRNKIIPEARGEAERLRNEAEGYRQQVVNNAKGEASRFGEVLSAYETAPGVTMQRLYLEAMQDVLKNKTKVILDAGRGGAVPYLPLGQYLPPARTPAAPSLPGPRASSLFNDTSSLAGER